MRAENEKLPAPNVPCSSPADIIPLRGRPLGGRGDDQRPAIAMPVAIFAESAIIFSAPTFISRFTTYAFPDSKRVGSQISAYG